MIDINPKYKIQTQKSSDSPALWLSVIIGSIAIHLLGFWTLHILLTRQQKSQVDSVNIAVDIIAIKPIEAQTKPLTTPAKPNQTVVQPSVTKESISSDTLPEDTNNPDLDSLEPPSIDDIDKPLPEVETDDLGDDRIIPPTPVTKPPLKKAQNRNIKPSRSPQKIAQQKPRPTTTKLRKKQTTPKPRTEVAKKPLTSATSSKKVQNQNRRISTPSKQVARQNPTPRIPPKQAGEQNLSSTIPPKKVQQPQSRRISQNPGSSTRRNSRPNLSARSSSRPPATTKIPTLPPPPPNPDTNPTPNEQPLQPRQPNTPQNPQTQAGGGTVVATLSNIQLANTRSNDNPDAGGAAKPLKSQKELDAISYASPAGSNLKEPTTVRVFLVIDNTGKVESTKVVQGSGIAEVDQLAMDILKEWAFQPAIQGGKPVYGELEVDIRIVPRRS